MDIKIEKNIPVAPLPGGPGRSEIYPWAQMSLGDSFFVRGITEKRATTIQALGVNWLKKNKVQGVGCVRRKVEHGYRFWLVEKKPQAIGGASMDVQRFPMAAHA